MNALLSLFRILFVTTLLLPIGFQSHAADLHHISRSDRLNGWKTLRDFEELFRKRRVSVVEILNEGHQVGLGTVVSEDGLIVTKASEFGQSLEVRLFDYSEHIPEFVSVDEKNDFALLKIDVKGLQPVEWSDPSSTRMGEWVLSPHEDETQVRIGVISAVSRQVPEKFGALGVVSVNGYDYLTEDDLLDLIEFAKKLNKGARPIDQWLKHEISDASKSALNKDLTDEFNKASLKGALLSDLNYLIFEMSLFREDRFEGVELSANTIKAIAGDRRIIQRGELNRMLLVDAYRAELAPGKKGAKILEVIPDSAAEEADLQPGDRIVSIGSNDVNGSMDLTRIVKQHTAGESIKLYGMRGSEQWNKHVTLRYFDSTFPHEDVNIALSGEISDRRSGFEKIIQHDIPLSPKAMGGPLVTLDGRVIGINIARFDRVATYALPSTLVQSLIEKLK